MNTEAGIAALRWQREGFLRSRGAETPFYAALAAEMIGEVERGGVIAQVLERFADAPVEDAYVLRLLAGLHRLALSEESPQLAAHFPSTGGDGDAHAAVVAVTDLLRDTPPIVSDMLDRPPQTNEVGRAAALASGVLVVADRFGLPLRLREMGASAGLNLLMDSYWYQQGARGWGDETSPVRFVDIWADGGPPFDATVEIADRLGCDRHPIDVSDTDDALTLLSYVWPEPQARFERAKAAIARAAPKPARVDRADARIWLVDQLSQSQSGTALLVYHSVFWQYLDRETQNAVRHDLAEAGRSATSSAPIVWLRLEPHPVNFVPAELRLTTWDGTATDGEDTLLATTGFHGGPIHWRFDARRGDPSRHA